MKKFSYTKINGAGNDFILVDKNKNPAINFTDSEISKLCDRQTGIGADGLIIIENDNSSDFKMLYYNADGSSGSLCGNGARCAIKYAGLSKIISNKQTRFISNNNIYRGEILSENVIKFFSQPPTKIKLNFKIKAYNQLITASYIDTGSPHVVINIEDVLSDPGKINSSFKQIEDFPVEIIGKEIRYAPEFQPAGVNVNFIQYSDTEIKIRSYEKGVEAETLACGTGSVAAAFISYFNSKKNPPIKLITKSNAELIVNFDIENKSFKNISLTGPVEIEHEGEYSI